MSYILAIETSTRNCSVAIFKDFNLLAFKEETTIEYSHAEQLTVYIKEVFQQTNSNINQLCAVAVSIGPGSYTGLRIGVSTAKGSCYGLDIRLFSISNLQAMSLSMQ